MWVPLVLLDFWSKPSHVPNIFSWVSLVLVRVYGVNPGYGVKNGLDCLAFRVKTGILVIRATSYIHNVAAPTYAAADSWINGVEGPYVYGILWCGQPEAHTPVGTITHS